MVLLPMSFGGRLGRVAVVFEVWSGLALVVFRVVRPRPRRAVEPGAEATIEPSLPKPKPPTLTQPDPALGETRSWQTPTFRCFIKKSKNLILDDNHSISCHDRPIHLHESTSQS